MKSPEVIQKGLDKKNEELTRLRQRIHNVQTWLESASFMQNEELFVSSVKERDELRRREMELQAQIPLLEWILDGGASGTSKPETENNS